MRKRKPVKENEREKIPQQRVYAGPEGWQSSSHAVQGFYFGKVKCVLIFEFVLFFFRNKFEKKFSLQNPMEWGEN